MATTTNLEINQLTEAQSGKASSVNIAVEALESALSGIYVLDSTPAATQSYTFVLPYDDSNDLSDRTALRFMVLEVAQGTDGNITVVHPDRNHIFHVVNRTAYTVTVETVTNDASVTVAANSTAQVYCNGTEIIEL
jgi:hypothetical protein